MTTKKQKSKPNYYNKLPRKATQNEFNTFIKPCLSGNKRGRKPIPIPVPEIIMKKF